MSSSAVALPIAMWTYLVMGGSPGAISRSGGVTNASAVTGPAGGWVPAGSCPGDAYGSTSTSTGLNATIVTNVDYMSAGPIHVLVFAFKSVNG